MFNFQSHCRCRSRYEILTLLSFRNDTLIHVRHYVQIYISGHTKDHRKNGTNCLPAWHAMR